MPMGDRGYIESIKSRAARLVGSPKRFDTVINLATNMGLFISLDIYCPEDEAYVADEDGNILLRIDL